MPELLALAKTSGLVPEHPGARGASLTGVTVPPNAAPVDTDTSRTLTTDVTSRPPGAEHRPGATSPHEAA